MIYFYQIFLFLWCFSIMALIEFKYTFAVIVQFFFWKTLFILTLEKNYFFRQAQQIFACIVLNFHLNIEVHSALVWPPSPLPTASILYNSYLFNSTSNSSFCFYTTLKLLSCIYLLLLFPRLGLGGWCRGGCSLFDSQPAMMTCA